MELDGWIITLFNSRLSSRLSARWRTCSNNKAYSSSFPAEAIAIVYYRRSSPQVYPLKADEPAGRHGRTDNVAVRGSRLGSALA